MSHPIRSVEKIIKLAIRSKAFSLALLAALGLTTFGIYIRYVVHGDNIGEPAQTVLVSLTTTLYAYISGLMTKAVYDYRKYTGIAGMYTGYAYKNEDDVADEEFYQIKDKSQSVAELEYVGGSDFRIQVSVTYPPQIDDLVWVGDFKMVSSNMASIAWWYTNERVKYEIGYKRAIIINNLIVLSSDGDSIHRREVFIKDTK